MEAVKALYAHLSGLKYNVEAWEAGLQLYRLSKSPPPTVRKDIAWRWKFVGAGECVFALHHLKKRIENVRGILVKTVPSLGSSIDMGSLRQAAKRFDEYFPEIVGLRDSLAHAGEFEAQSEKHAPDGGFALTGFREGDVYSAPFQKKLHHLEISEASLVRIEEVVDLVFAGFRPASYQLEMEGHLE